MPFLDDVTDALLALGAGTTGPVVVQVRLLAFDEAGIELAEAHTRSFRLGLSGGVAHVMEPTRVELPEELLAVAPELQGAAATQLAIPNERTEVPPPPTTLDNSDKEVDHLPAVRKNEDLHRPPTTRGQLEEVLADRGALDRLDELWEAMVGARMARDQQVLALEEGAPPQEVAP